MGISTYMNFEQNEQQALWDALSYFDNVEQLNLPNELEALERSRIHDALINHKNNRSKAASELGIGRTLLIHKIKKYDL